MHENRETSEASAVAADHRTAGEGPGRTARMYACEESDSGVVPMNHSNKDGKPRAESEEGRLLIGENNRKSSTPRHRARPACSIDGRLCGKHYCRYSSSIRAVCANERSYGSVRGVPGDWYPYRDQLVGENASQDLIANSDSGRNGKPQISPLRCAPVEMTNKIQCRAAWPSLKEAAEISSDAREPLGLSSGIVQFVFTKRGSILTSLQMPA